MIGFFRINDPYRLLILFLAVVFIRLPYFISSEPLVYELNWMLIGETLNQGNILYKDFLAPIAPLAAWMYTAIDFIFGRAPMAYQILATLLMGYQFVLFNSIMHKNKAYNENTYVPAFVYALLMQVFFDFFTLSPVLVSMTFILLVLDNIYLRIENKLNDLTILKTGFFMGMAVLFYLPSIIFLLATVISFVLLTGLIFRRYLMFFYGFLLPIAAVGLYYFWHDALGNMMYQWIISNFVYNQENMVGLISLLLFISLPLLVFVLALYKTFSISRFTNYQVRVQQVMFMMFAAAWVVWILGDVKAPYQLIVFVPFIAFFIAHFILQFRKKATANLFTIFFTFSLIFVNYILFYQNFHLHKWGDFNALWVNESIYEPWVAGKKVLVVGNGRQIYHSASGVATKFYDWKLSQNIWEMPNDPKKLAVIYDDLVKNQPETIIDLDGYAEAVLENLPGVSSEYEKVNYKVYVLKN
ncbi:hypothetical protein JKA74_11715 [Marivirga sp. S37H4]|uniref:Uncharacterized protein n=1 Tax=Marivirga aurantiaca TaxID=2802615 RepID=A0A935C8V4_9BACT|nr:hypothetical protein [Marivirga aurantiaca]MBK6265705.1 hypothetical protein [Marivirga aurantiaca]